jgi:hypothetical protein
LPTPKPVSASSKRTRVRTAVMPPPRESLARPALTAGRQHLRCCPRQSVGSQSDSGWTRFRKRSTSTDGWWRRIHRHTAPAALYILSGLGAVGEGDNALTTIREAVQIYRELVRTNAAAYLTDLSASLRALCRVLGDVAHPEWALARIQEPTKRSVTGHHSPRRQPPNDSS